MREEEDRSSLGETGSRPDVSHEDAQKHICVTITNT